MKFLSNLIAGPGALLVLGGFFLPWVAITISCSTANLLTDGLNSGFTDTSIGDFVDPLYDDDYYTDTSNDFSLVPTIQDLDVNASGYDLATGRALREANEWAALYGGDLSNITESDEAQDLSTSVSSDTVSTDEIDSLDLESGLTPDPTLWGVFGISLVVLGLAAARFLDTKLYPSIWTGGTYILLGLVGLTICGVKYAGLQEHIGSPIHDFNQEMEDYQENLESFTGGNSVDLSLTEIFQFQFEIGFYLTIFGFILIIIGGGLAFAEPPEKHPSPPIPIQPRF